MTTPSVPRERDLVRAFVRLADTLVDDYDVIDLFHALCADCVRLLAADAAGLLLSDQRGHLQVVSASSEAAQLVELFQLQSDAGPCVDCFASGGQVHAHALASDARWPRFSALAVSHGFTAVNALPMRLRGQTIGALNLYYRGPGSDDAAEIEVGQALADVATIAILSDRSTRERELLTEQLQAALTSRVTIEQAKGVLAERGRIGMDEAFARLRTYSRSSGERLAELARAVVGGTRGTEDILGP